MKNRRILITSIFVLIVVLGIYIFTLISRSIDEMNIVSYSELAINNMNLSNNSFTANVMFVSSSKSIRKYTYDIIGENLYIVIYGGLVNSKFPNGDFIIDVKDNLNNVNNIYLKNRNEEVLLFNR